MTFNLRSFRSISIIIHTFPSASRIKRDKSAREHSEKPALLSGVADFLILFPAITERRKRLCYAFALLPKVQPAQPGPMSGGEKKARS